jgi:hypothetical protein
LTADMNEHSAVSPDHQLPAYVPSRPRHKVVWIVVCSLLALVLVFALVLRHHEEAKKAAAMVRPVPRIAVISATASQPPSPAQLVSKAP